jgi:FKBP-type peptidyl-prolyl cis-trans isomerase FkpA
MKTTATIAAIAGLTLGATPTLHAQVSTAEAEVLPAIPDPEMNWSDSDFAEIAGLLTGTWKTTSPVDLFDGSGEQAEIVMSIAPAPLSTLPDALYVETARADAPDRPYRAAFLQLYWRQGEIRMRTLEVRDPNSPVNNLLIGMWAAPGLMPDIPREAMIATLDLTLTRSGDGWVGRTPYPYPSALGEAVEMTSRMQIGPGRLVTADRGYDAEGKVVWGAGEGDAYTFAPAEPPFVAEARHLGLVVITLRDEESPVPVEGDTVAFQYTGWLTNGQMFDTSRRQGARPLQYTIPGNLIEGWNIATEGMSQGDWRKFIVPPELGYGSSSAAGGNIPANSTLIFEAELVGARTQAGD